MVPTDPDLQAGLADPALEAASSKGLLRRSHRDREAGLVRLVSADDGIAVLEADGETVRLGAGGLTAAICTCPARDTCRHILAAAIVLREDAAAMGALSQAASAAGNRPAEKRRAAGAQRAPNARTARAAKRSTVPQAPVVETRAEPDAAPPETATLPKATPSPETSFLDAVAEALREAARSALASAPAALEERLLDLAVSSRAEAIPNLAGALRAIAADMGQRRARATLFDPADALAAIARAYALAHALRRDGADPRLRGELRGAYDPHPSLDLVGCGVTVWRSDAGARGLTAYFLAVGNGSDATAEPRWLTVTLARAAGQDPAWRPREAVASEPVWGSSLDRLGRSAFRLEQPRISGDGRLGSQRESRALLGTASWHAAVTGTPGAVLTDWGVLAQRLAGRFAPTLRRPYSSAQPLLLAPAALGPPQFDAMSQAAWIPAADRAGRWLRLQVEGGECTDSHLDTLAAASAEGVSTLVVLARLDGAEVLLTPIAAARGPDGPLDHLDLPLPRPRAADEGMLTRLRRGLADLGRAALRGDQPSRLVPAAPLSAVTARLLAAAADEALALAELGGRMEDPERMERLRTLSERFEAAGLSVLGRLLLRLAQAGAADRPHHLLLLTHALACFRGLAPNIPLLRRAA